MVTVDFAQLRKIAVSHWAVQNHDPSHAEYRSPLQAFCYSQEIMESVSELLTTQTSTPGSRLLFWVVVFEEKETFYPFQLPSASFSLPAIGWWWWRYYITELQTPLKHTSFKCFGNVGKHPWNLYCAGHISVAGHIRHSPPSSFISCWEGFAWHCSLAQIEFYFLIIP